MWYYNTFMNFITKNCPYMDLMSIYGDNEIWLTIKGQRTGIIKCFFSNKILMQIFIPHTLTIIDDKITSAKIDGTYSNSWCDDIIYTNINEKNINEIQAKLTRLNTRIKELYVMKRINKMNTDFK